MPRCSALLSLRFALSIGLGCAALGLWAGSAHAGGFEIPANGTEALGRGGAFTAKADSTLALEYNVAGLAGQRGTRLHFDNNIYLSSYGLATPGGEQVRSTAGPFYAPWFGLSSDFGYFDRFTFAIGGFGPSSVGRRTYDAKGAGRYDIINTDLLVFYPTIAVGYRPHRIIDIGLSLGTAVGTYKLQTAASLVIASPCNMPAKPNCDTLTDLSLSTFWNPVVTLGVLLHPLRMLDVGLQVRSAPNFGAKDVAATGTLTATIPQDSQISPRPTLMNPQDATFTANLPWVIRGGLRYVHRKERREVFDVELDAVYELWSKAQGTGNQISSTSPSLGTALEILSPHVYKDTISVRLGGAYTQPLGALALTVRAGVYYDSAASPEEFQRLDFDTLAKIAGTVGLGLRVRGVTVNAAYAYVHSLSRTVQNGQLLPLSATSDDGTWPGTPPAAVNNGTYDGRNHILSLGLSVLFEELVRGDAWSRRDR